MISLRFRDLLTELVEYDAGVPGEAGSFFRETLGLEEDRFNAGDVRKRIAASVDGAGYQTLAPWPRPFPNRAWLDSIRYTDGIELDILSLDGVLGVATPIPEGTQVLDSGHGLEPGDAPQSRAYTWRELQATGPAFHDWLRLDTKNELTHQLGPELVLQWRAPKVGRYRLRVPDNDLVTPFDLSHPERYVAARKDGTVGGGADMDILHGETVVYLMPRKWRFIAKTIAHYMYVTPFETVLNDETFIIAWNDRPPFWPVRTNVEATKGRADLWWFDGTPLAWDDGIEYYWEHCEHYATLVREIVQQQYFSMCVSYILIGVEPAMITVERERVDGTAAVAIIERHGPGGVTSRATIIPRTSQVDLYPRQFVGVFYGNFAT